MNTNLKKGIQKLKSIQEQVLKNYLTNGLVQTAKKKNKTLLKKNSQLIVSKKEEEYVLRTQGTR